MRVNIATTGGDLDLDGYQLVIDSGPRHGVGLSAAVMLDSLSAGPHLLALEGVADNCTVAGEHPLSLNIVSGGMEEVHFSVVCVVTGISVTALVTGSDMPPAFSVLVDGERAASLVTPGGSVLISRLSPGNHTVELSSTASNCAVAGSNPVTISVARGTAVPVNYEVVCARSDKSIAFVLDSVVNRRGLTSPWIVVADSNGSSVLPLVAGHSPAWSPDGTRLAFSTTVCDDYYGQCGGGLLVMQPDNRSSRVLTLSAYGDDPSWSPDGDMIAWVQHYSQAFGFTTLHVSRLDGSSIVQLAAGETSEVGHPSWSPDGKRIVFQCRIGSISSNICISNRDGTGFKQLTSGTVYDADPAWSPDGSKIAFTTHRFANPPAIALMAPDGTGIVHLTSGSVPSWLPSGSKLVFARYDGIFTINSDGSNVMRKTTGRHGAPVWRP
ncbi:MAG: hypothetical protein ACR2L6_09115 [Gemmatimonadaceae bacterium]